MWVQLYFPDGKRKDREQVCPAAIHHSFFLPFLPLSPFHCFSGARGDSFGNCDVKYLCSLYRCARAGPRLLDRQCEQRERARPAAGRPARARVPATSALSAPPRPSCPHPALLRPAGHRCGRTARITHGIVLPAGPARCRPCPPLATLPVAALVRVERPAWRPGRRRPGLLGGALRRTSTRGPLWR